MFKKMILGAVAAATLATPMIATEAAAAPQRTVTTVRHDGPNGHYTERTVARRDDHRAWRKGQRFDRRYASNYRVVDYRAYRGRGLYAPPRGYHWVRSGNDAVLVAITSGLIGAVIGNAIR